MAEQPHGRVRQALAQNTAMLRVAADRYVSIIAGADRAVQQELAKPNPSQWKIQALNHLRERAENNLARFKAGPDHVPDWLWNTKQAGRQ